MRKTATIGVLIAALCLGAAATAEAKPARSLSLGEAQAFADDIAFDAYLAVPEAASWGAYPCYTVSRTKVDCETFIGGTDYECGYDYYYGYSLWCDFKCSWTTTMWTKKRPRRPVFYATTEPYCYFGPQYKVQEDSDIRGRSKALDQLTESVDQAVRDHGLRG
jgi:hypothetical protein